MDFCSEIAARVLCWFCGERDGDCHYCEYSRRTNFPRYNYAHVKQMLPQFGSIDREPYIQPARSPHYIE
jgi:hypothetical protein